MVKDYYKILGIPPTASEKEIKGAYKKLAFQYHPDRNKNPGAAKNFKEVNEAYQALLTKENNTFKERTKPRSSNSSLQDLENLIITKEIEFYSYGRKLDADLEDFGEHNWDLVKHLLHKTGNKISLEGSGLETYLTKPQNLFTLASFLTQFWYEGAKRFPDIALCVNVDIKKFEKHYQQPDEEKLINGLGEIVGDAASWVPEMPYFEKVWNFALDQAIGGMVGYPGYEHPPDDASFRYCVAEFAENYMIGTPKQIKRYKKYALDALNNVTAISDELKNNPKSIFKNYDKLQGLEMVSRHARIIAENVAHFSVIENHFNNRKIT